MDLLQFKLYLVRYRRHLIRRGDPERIERLEEELAKAHGKLLDTRYTQRGTAWRCAPGPSWTSSTSTCPSSPRRTSSAISVTWNRGSRALPGDAAAGLASLRRFIGLLVKEKYPVPAEVLEKLNDMDIRRVRRLPIALEREEAQDFLRVAIRN